MRYLTQIYNDADLLQTGLNTLADEYEPIYFDHWGDGTWRVVFKQKGPVPEGVEVVHLAGQDVLIIMSEYGALSPEETKRLMEVLVQCGVPHVIATIKAPGRKVEFRVVKMESEGDREKELSDFLNKRPQSQNLGQQTVK